MAVGTINSALLQSQKKSDSAVITAAATTLQQVRELAKVIRREQGNTNTNTTISAKNQGKNTTSRPLIPENNANSHPLVQESPQNSQPIFSASEHLNISPPTHKHTFTTLHLPQPATAPSPIAATSPFPLFSASALPLLRKVLLDTAHLDKTASFYSRRTLIVRNAAAHSRFYREIWTCPEVMRAVSDAAGVELEVVMETVEIGHANVQVDMERYQGISRGECLKAIAGDLTSGEVAERAAGRGGAAPARGQREIEEEVWGGGGGSIIPWHYDSYPFVCVVMLSDTTSMIGGETVIQRGDGALQAIPQPPAGSATMLQGGLVRHLALPARGTTDRITLITSYRAKATGLHDYSFLTNVRPYTDLAVLYPQWVSYRSRVLAASEYVPSTAFAEKYHRHTQRQMPPKAHIDALVARFGIAVFYAAIEGYTQGTVFSGAPEACPVCGVQAKVDKAHMAVCGGATTKWMPGSELWGDVERSRAAGGFEGLAGVERPDIVAVVERFKREGGREWGMADELAVQGLAEYLVEFLALFGVVVG